MRLRFEIVLVDNGSTDGSSAYVESRYPSVRIVQTGRNLGYAGGNNAGARVARGAWLAFLNNDTVAAPDWLARLEQVAGAREGAALVTSRLEFLPSRATSTVPGMDTCAPVERTSAGTERRLEHGCSQAKSLARAALAS